MKHTFMSLAIALSLPAIANADITVNFTEKPSADKLIVSHVLISDLTANNNSRSTPVQTDTIDISALSVSIPVTPQGDARYRLFLSDAPSATRDNRIDFYTSPGDNLTVAVESTTPLIYSVSGSPLMDGMTQVNNKLAPLEEEIVKIQTGQLPEEALQGISEAYDAILSEYIDANPTSPAAVYAMLSLEDDLFFKYYDNINPELKNTPLYPFLASDKAERERRRALEEKKKAFTTGDVTAPDFTLQNIDGKKVSLSDFRGKWVVLDFWGSWCVWCIKGFPELKKAYEQYAGKMEVIGIDCGDTTQAWKAAVAKYKLPWVNLYNAQGPGDLTTIYPVQGFPTKIIISPEGKIIDVFTGEVPSFYTRLAQLIKN
ncbi:MAG: TlpA family protein disulfide reductase [Prevotella sp.]|nr:TlpA family protein disulfide reductase [Bacteroides sp.]MCM1367033.1 TlpA family protein disulfide reductase [Prevotella sp.]MCM1437507.1 TlpA family protein disulfide reductase [Prevotella sp.]